MTWADDAAISTWDRIEVTSNENPKCEACKGLIGEEDMEQFIETGFCGWCLDPANDPTLVGDQNEE